MQNVFLGKISDHGIISVGIEGTEDADWNVTKRKYNLPEAYLLFVGRIDRGKLSHIIQYYLNYKKRYKQSDLKLVLVGGLFLNLYNILILFIQGLLVKTKSIL